MDAQELSHWMARFAIEVRNMKGGEYQPNTLYHIVCGVMRYVRTTKPGIDFFKDAEFAGFRASLDAEMKRLQAKGVGSMH